MGKNDTASVSNDDLLATNYKWWQERAGLHAISDFYHVQDVINGENRLGQHEIDEVGDVHGKRLIHLQCHLGTETIGWSRLGAKVTGVDFSEEVVRNARKLAKASGVDTEYIHGNVYDAPTLLGHEIADIVYVNISSLHWLPDINRWGKVVAQLLKPEGKLYVNEIHPVSSVLAEDSPTFERNYFDEKPVIWNEDGSYADTKEPTKNNDHVVWDRPLQSIFGAIIGAGLVITNFKERPNQEYQQFPYQKQAKNGLWYTPDGYPQFPSNFSLTAVKSTHNPNAPKE